MFIGRDLMRELDIDTSIRDDTITWGELTCNMVPKGYWTKERINLSVSKLTREANRETQLNQLTEKGNIPN